LKLGPRAIALKRKIADALLQAAGPRVELNEDPIDGLCSDMFRPPAPKLVAVSDEVINEECAIGYDWATNHLKTTSLAIAYEHGLRAGLTIMRDLLAQPQSNKADE
jgi:hypothetical protein